MYKITMVTPVAVAGILILPVPADDIINQPRIRTEANGINNKGVARHPGGRLLSGHR